MSPFQSISFVVILSTMLAFAFQTSLKRTSAYRKKGMATFPSLSATLISHAEASTSAISHPAFEEISRTRIAEYGVDAIYYKHKKSQAQVLSIIAPQDENKVFGITFRTPPKDSTGIPHILEHSVLCGSRKYPVKEPFVDLMRGSLQTFLNAFTYPDRTCYPVASMNSKDFYNLINVYLDAVLHPRAIKDDFVLKQEGWHYELENKSDPLELKGVVYNEMKGVYSSPDSLLGRETQQSLFPDNTYGVDSGGDPLVIPQLTFEQFKSFHESYYHPSNSRIYFYGDDDPVKRLELLDEYLKEFDAKPVDSSVTYQKKIDVPRSVKVPFPIGKSAPLKHMLTVNWLLNDKPLPPKEMLALSVLNHLLLATPTSPLKKSLIESKLGESVTGGGLSDELLQSTFGVGLKGVLADDCEKVEKLVLQTLSDLAVSGFDQDDIKASINTIEFSLREFNTGSFPRGLSMMLGMLSQWIYDKNPLDGVTFESALSDLKSDLTSGRPVFQELLKSYIIENKHRVTVEMVPDAELETKSLAEEAEKLKKIKESMNDEQLETIVDSTRLLKAAQEAEDSPEARASIPRLDITDINPKVKDIPIEVETRAETGVILTHNLETSGILYADVAFKMTDLDEDDLALLPILSRMIMESGTKLYDEVTLTRKIGINTGGVGTSFISNSHSTAGKVSDPDNALMYLLIRGKSVKGSIPELFHIFEEVLLGARLDNQKRALEILKETKAKREASVISNGHSYGATRVAARYSLLGYLNELTSGITFVRSIGKLLDEAENDWPKMSQRLEKLRTAIVKKGEVVINLTGDKVTLEASKSSVESFIQSLPKNTVQSSNKVIKDWDRSKLLPAVNEGFIIPSQVNYVVKGASVLQPGESVSGSYSVASRFLSTNYMWNQVRVMGGAYGGFARFGGSSGRFMLMSYRDPNLVKTMDIYDEASDYLEGTEVSDEDILQSVIGSVGDLDSPLSPDQKGFESMQRYITGESIEEIQKWREDTLKTSIDDFRVFASKLKEVKSSGSVVVFGSQAALDSANKDLAPEKALAVSQAF